VGLTGETGDSPTGGDTLETVSLGDSKNINKLILGEDRVDSDFLLKEALGKVNLSLGISSSVDLDLHDVGLLDTKVKLLYLGVGDNTHNLAELGNTLKLSLNVLAVVLSVLLGVLGVSLTLALVPVLVATTLELFTQMLSENRGEGTKTTRSLNVTDNTHNNHGRSLKDGHCIDNLTLVHDGSRTVNATDDMGHTGLVGTEGGEMGRGRRIIVLGETADATRVVLGTLLGEVSQVTTTGGFEFTVRHG